MEEVEIWKDVVGCNGFYQVSSLGKVNSMDYKRMGVENMLSPFINSNYLTLNLFKLGKLKNRNIYSLVAEAFIDKDYKKKRLVVNHINFNKEDNRLKNLEVVTIRENSNQKHIKSSSIYTGISFCKNRNKWISAIKLNGNKKYLGFFDCEKEASEYYKAALLCVNEGRINDIKIKRVLYS